MFKRILVANRGEIALRIFRACREMGIETVAIFSEADRGAAYLALADEAYCVGPPKAADSYLKIDRVISAAEIGNVQAIHPGYGFLAENPHFAEVCRSCEIEFIGPTHEAMALVGDKNAARRLAKRASRRRGLVLLGAVGTVLMVVVWVGLLTHWAKRSSGDDERTVRYERWPTVRARTARYGLLYPGDRAGLVTQLLDRADAVEGRVRQFLGAQPIPWIMADLTGSDPHTAGVAHWKQVQIDLHAIGTDADELTAVFAHETTHLYIDHESQNRMDDDPDTTRFFHEGLATYVEYHLFRPPAALARLRRVAATMHARRQVSFEELIHREALARKYDVDLVYPLGEVFVDALVRRYGEPAVGQVIRTFARPGAPTGLKGAAQWRDVLQAQRGDLSDVEDLFFAALDRAAAEHRNFIDSLPRLRGAVHTEGGYIAVRASYDGRSPGTILCRFRPNADTPERLYEYAPASAQGVFRVEHARYPERSFWYQLGWRVPGASQPIYEPWVEITSR